MANQLYDAGQFALDLDQVLEEIRSILLEKNRKYGDSALAPVRIVSKADPVEQIKVRIDDKLSRLRSGQPDDTEDVFGDIRGYFILLRIAEIRRERELPGTAVVSSEDGVRRL